MAERRTYRRGAGKGVESKFSSGMNILEIFEKGKLEGEIRGKMRDVLRTAKTQEEASQVITEWLREKGVIFSSPFVSFRETGPDQETLLRLIEQTPPEDKARVAEQLGSLVRRSLPFSERQEKMRQIVESIPLAPNAPPLVIDLSPVASHRIASVVINYSDGTKPVTVGVSCKIRFPKH